jgi:Spy/CpxP family protein refolding chaperone
MVRYLLVGVLAAAVVLAGATGICAAEKGKKPEGPPPKPLVVQFKHIPAQSFMETLKQLGRNEQVGDILSKVPMAVNEPANSVVVIGPPEVTEYLAAIAKGLDQPNVFSAAQEERQREQESFRLKMEEARRKILGPPSPGGVKQPAVPPQGPVPRTMPQTGRPGQPSGMVPPMGPAPGRGPAMGGPMGRGPQMGPPPQRGPGMGPGMGMGMGRGMGMGGPMRGPQMDQPMGPPEGRGPGTGGPMGGGPQMGPPPQRGPGMGPGMGMGRGMGMGGPMQRLRPLWRLTSPEARERLGLSEQQTERIRGILSETSARMARMTAALRQEASNAPPEQRPQRMREVMERRMAECAEIANGAREAVMNALNPDQRERLDRFLQEGGPVGAGQQPGVSRPPSPGPDVKPPEGRRPAEERRPAEGRRPVEGRPASALPERAVERAPARLLTIQDGVAPVIVAPAEAAGRFLPAVEDAGPPPPGDRRGPAIRPRQTEANAQGPLLRLIEDPTVRARLGLSEEQETKVFTLLEKARRVRARIRDEAEAQHPQEKRRRLSEDERRAARQELKQSLEEAAKAARGEFQAIANEIEELLTPQQREKLRAIAREHVRRQMATGGLDVLASSQVREQLGLTDEQAEKIRAVVRDLEEASLKLRKEMVGPGEPPPPGEPAAESVRQMRKRHETLLKDARAKIMDLLTPEQREKADRILAERGPGRPDRPPGNRNRPQAQPATKGYSEAV